MAAQRERTVTYTNLTATDHARFHAGDNYNTYNHSYTIRQRRSDETLRESDRHRAFIQAIVEGQVPRVLTFLRMGVDLDETGTSDLTALHRAILSGHQDLLLKPLIEAGADVNAISVDFGTPLCLAALKGMDEAVKLLLQSKAKASMVTGKLGSALHCCVLSVGDHKDTAAALIGAGADVSTQARIDTRWLHAVCAWDGDDRSPIASLEQFEGCILSDATPVLIAIRTLQEGLFELLLAHDLNRTFTIEFLEAKVNVRNPAYSHRFVRQVRHGVFEKTTTSSRHSYLDSCAVFGQLESARLLVAKGAALDLTDGDYTPMHSAASEGRSTLVKLLIESGAPIGNDWTALHEGARFGYAEVIRQLCEHGVPVDVRSADGTKPVHTAALYSCSYSNLQLCRHLEALIDSGADINARDGRGRTPVLIALQAGQIMQPKAIGICKQMTTPSSFNVPFLEKLIRARADLRLRAADGTSVLSLCVTRSIPLPAFKVLVQGKGFDETIVDRMYTTLFSSSSADYGPRFEAGLNLICARRGHEDLRLLSLLGADLDANGDDGWTAMHLAAKNNDFAVIDRLLIAGALLHPQTNLMTPLAVAVQAKQLGAVQILLDRGADPYLKSAASTCAMQIALQQSQHDITALLRKAASRFADPNFNEFKHCTTPEEVEPLPDRTLPERGIQGFVNSLRSKG